jgi:Flp pilus assembly protein TadD
VALFLPLLAQLTIAVSAPDTVAVLEPIVLTVEMAADGTRPPRLTAPNFGSLSVGQTNASTYIGTDNGASRVHVDIRYVLEASRPGDYVVAPFEARIGRDVVRSRSLHIVVRGATTVTIPPIVTHAPFDPTAPVSVAATLTPDTVYVGEQFTYQVAVFVDEAVRNRLRRTPGFAPPELRGMLAYDLSPVRGILPTRKIGDRRFEPHLYQRAIFPLVAGTHVIPSAELQYSLPLSYSFFSREESRVLRTDSLIVVARDVPTDGRPADYAGAVGVLALGASIGKGAPRVGDPSVLTLKVTGTGNIKMLPRPSIAIPWAALVAAQERVTVDWSSEVIRGSKEFDWVITPHVAGRQELPALRYAFFNPKTKQYEIALSPPETLTVSPGGLIANDSAAADTVPLLPLRATYRGAPAPPLQTYPGYWLLLVGAPVPALLTALARRPRKRKVPSAATILRSLKVRKKTQLPAGDVRRAYVNALAQRLQLTPGALATRAEFARALRRSGVSSQTTELAITLLGELDGAAYGTRPAAMSGLLRRAQESYAAVDAEARVLGTNVSIGTNAVLMAAMMVVGAGAAVFAATQTEEHQLFGLGAQQYEGRRFVDAEHTFGEITRLAPGAPDAWANFGTAAWAASDTAAAVVGWQRALRLEPLARDVRSNLAIVQSPRLGSFAWVPPVPVSVLVIAIAVLWVGAWLLALARAAGVGIGRGAATAMASAALLLASGAIVLDERLASRDIAVVRETTMLRALPALGADGVLSLHPGEMARRLSRRGEWALVRLQSGREGWVEAPMLIPIARN